ncbi:hypothetical protein MITSMUL_04516 [Mitsuokella multacida DSM 20544]|uniref:Uncharacterized protein n=1 Tax=Mitsuokella multacida DSM 20544 TaxID=500635 RepID=C9KMS4_9FIRM|nr:hypothetical protein MITSMUL_04516 [Mitsuokella multacida DSM 20544]
MCLDNVFVTVFLFCFSLLPMAYLRYYPFRIIATLREQRILIAGHLIIFVVEFLLVTALFVSGHAPMQGNAFQKLYFVCYWPYFLLLMFTIRPFWFRHFFVLGIQAIYAVFIHTATVLLLKQIWMQMTYFASLYFICYLTLLLLSFPGMIWLLGRLFTREQLMKAQWTASSFWKYLGFVPLLLAFYQGSMGYVDLLQQVQDLSGVHLYMLVSRGILVIIGGILVISVRSGFRQVQYMFHAKERSMKMQEHLREIHDYANTLQEEQQKLAILRHDSRHQLRVLAELIESGHYDEAERHLRALRKEVERR